MKTVVSVQEVTELEIKPAAQVAEWRALVESEITSRWKDRSSWVKVACPCCSSERGTIAFSHATISYNECSECGSVYAPTRPNESEIGEWYRESAPARFWRDTMIPASVESRLEKVILPRAQWILDGVAEYLPHASGVIDVSTNGGALLDQLAHRAPSLGRLVSSGITADVDRAATNGSVSNANNPGSFAGLGPVNVVTAFDALDRASDMNGLVKSIHQVLSPRGLLFATVPVSSGFEIQALWEHSPTIFPPDKLNVPSVRGLLKLFGSSGWEVLELSTTGMFDVEIVSRQIAAAPNEKWSRAVRALVEGSTSHGLQAFTEYLQSQRLTSFARLVARRIN